MAVIKRLFEKLFGCKHKELETKTKLFLNQENIDFMPVRLGAAKCKKCGATDLSIRYAIMGTGSGCLDYFNWFGKLHCVPINPGEKRGYRDGNKGYKVISPFETGKDFVLVEKL